MVIESSHEEKSQILKKEGETRLTLAEWDSDCSLVFSNVEYFYYSNLKRKGLFLVFINNSGRPRPKSG